MMSGEEESAFVFVRQVEARRFVESVLAHAIEHELTYGEGSIKRWWLEGITHKPTRKLVLKAAYALAKKLRKASRR